MKLFIDTGNIKEIETLAAIFRGDGNQDWKFLGHLKPEP